MKKTFRYIALLAIPVFIFGIGVYYFGFRQGHEDIIEQNENIVAHTIETFEKKSSAYEITAHYPKFSGLDTIKADKINLIIKEQIENEIASYEDELEDAAEYDSLATGIFNADSAVVLETSALISIRFNISTYLSGAAHPFNYVKGLNIDVGDTSLIELDDVFYGNYLDVLSDLSRAKLLQERALSFDTHLDQQQEQWIREGTEAREENFTAFALGADSITFFFNPYQVAPYAAGIVETPIPYSDIMGIIHNDSPVYYLLSS